MSLYYVRDVNLVSRVKRSYTDQLPADYVYKVALGCCWTERSDSMC